MSELTEPNPDVQEAAPVVRPWDVVRLLAQPAQTSRILRAAVRDPIAFWKAMVAIRRFRAVQKPLELHGYLAGLRRLKPACAMEIGSRWGGTFQAHAAVVDSNGVLISLDWHPTEDGQTMVNRFKTLARGQQRVTCIWADSHSSASRDAVQAALGGRLLDVLFIDGDHSLDGVRADFEMYSPLVRRGGWVAFHDIVDEPPPGTGVPTFWRSLKQHYENFEFVDPHYPPQGMGIGVVVKK